MRLSHFGLGTFEERTTRRNEVIDTGRIILKGTSASRRPLLVFAFHQIHELHFVQVVLVFLQEIGCPRTFEAHFHLLLLVTFETCSEEMYIVHYGRCFCRV